MLRIGLTGGIGSGKTTVAKYFAKLGAKIIDADQISHQLLAKNTISYRKIIAHFGKQALNKNQTINRALLREIIFKNPQKKKWLEQLLHPEIIKELKNRSKNSRNKYCILVIPLLFEKKLFALVDRILVVDAPISQQIARAIKRDKINKSQAKAIIKTQISRLKRKNLADDLICNDSDLKTLKNQIKIWHQRYLSFAKNK